MLVGRNTLAGGDKALRFSEQQSSRHLPRPETIHTPLPSPQGGGWQTPHTFRILICKALLQALTLRLQMDHLLT